MRSKVIVEAWLESPGGRRWPLAASCAIGRMPGNQLVLSDANVSRRHALVHCQDGREYWLVDLGSSNGTYLNGRRVVRPTPLRSGDTIKMGEEELVFGCVLGNESVTSLTGPPATMHQIKTVEYWMLLLDLVDSTNAGQSLSPKELAMLTGRWLSGCKDIVEEHGGSINKYLGDGLLAYWPANDSPDKIVKMLKDLRPIQEQASPRFRCVLHVGQLAVGGEGSLGEECLVGMELNLVFRLEKLAGEIGTLRLMSRAAATRLRGLLEARPAGFHRIKGFTDPVQVEVW